MTKFDWRRFLDQHGVEYRSGGPSTARGNLYVKCPFCARANEQDFYMGISVQGQGWGCWRTREHRGKSRARLIQALLGCAAEHARVLAGEEQSTSLADHDFAATIAATMSGPAIAKAPHRAADLAFPQQITPLGSQAGGVFCRYLQQRGYNDARGIAERYGLRCALHGAFRYRIVFPVEHSDGLVTWTGRTVVRGTIPRYRALSADPEKAEKSGLPVARMSIHQCLWRAGALAEGGDTLLLCEGPFDALRLDSAGSARGVRATCPFGKSISREQVNLLELLTRGFRRRYLLFDQAEWLNSFETNQVLLFMGFKVLHLPKGVKDPGLFSERQALDFIKSI